MATYTPRRMPKRFLDGAPEGLLDLFDDPGFADRYTAIYREVHEHPRGDYLIGRGMSANPFGPQGFGVSFEMAALDLGPYRDRVRRKRIAWADLPEQVQECIRMDLEEDR